MESVNPAELFKQLPLSLQHKIVPPLRLNVEYRAVWDRMEASITHGKKGIVAAVASVAQPTAREALPPLTNRGGKSEPADEYLNLPSFEAKEFYKIVPLGKEGKFQKVMIPLPDKSKNERHAFVDWVNFTFKSANLPMQTNTGHQAIDNDDYVEGLSRILFSIFGFGVIGKRPSGMNFYQESYDLGPHGWGLVCIGGQRDSVLVTVKGQGLMAAKPGWEGRLYHWLKGVHGAVLTRIDLASDNFHSKVTMDDYLAMYDSGLFTGRGRTPNVEQAGNWRNPNGKGRTLYIGNRKSGKLLRIYEKGLQLAGGFSEMFPNWVRVELELKNDCVVIPLEALLRPGQYLAGAYPALANMHQIQTRIETHKKTVQSSFDRALEVTRHQFGRYIWTFSQIFGADEAIKKLTDGKQELPAKLFLADTFQEFGEEFYIHTTKQPTYQLGELSL